jgi:hypothetical protein
MLRQMRSKCVGYAAPTAGAGGDQITTMAITVTRTPRGRTIGATAIGAATTGDVQKGRNEITPPSFKLTGRPKYAAGLSAEGAE